MHLIVWEHVLNGEATSTLPVHELWEQQAIHIGMGSGAAKVCPPRNPVAGQVWVSLVKVLQLETED